MNENTATLIMFGGLTLIILVIFSVTSGLGYIKTTQKAHKISGLLILILSVVHAIIGLTYLLGN